MRQTIEPQSVSSTSSRPPGRSTRRASASAAGDVLDVLEHLGRDDDVEARVGDRQLERATGDELGGVRTPAREREHALARIDADDAAVRGDLCRHLGGQHAGAGSDVEHTLAGPQRQDLARGPPLLDDVRRRVDLHQPLRGLLVELEHGRIKPRCRSPEGFRRRHAEPDSSLPPGQYLTLDFPVLSAGPTPRVPLDEWRFEIGERSWSWDEFVDLPSETITVDIHCVTSWSKLGTRWEGVSVDTLLEDVEPAPT